MIQLIMHLMFSIKLRGEFKMTFKMDRLIKNIQKSDREQILQQIFEK